MNAEVQDCRRKGKRDSYQAEQWSRSSTRGSPHSPKGHRYPTSFRYSRDLEVQSANLISLGTTAVPDRQKPVMTLPFIYRSLIFSGSLHTLLQSSQQSPVYGLGKWGSQKWVHLPKVKQLWRSVSQYRIQTRVFWGQNPSSFHQNMLMPPPKTS